MHRSITLYSATVALAASTLWLTAISSVQAHEPVTTKGCNQNALVPDPENNGALTPEEYEVAAKIEFNRCHRITSYDPEIPSSFRPNFDFPKELPDTSNLPWKDIHPIKEPERYMRAVWDYASSQCGDPAIDWDGVQCGWYHAPWMHNVREPVHGLTRERRSRLGELHPSQTRRTGNWAVGMYNDVGGYGFHRIWGEKRAYPKTKDFAFDEGTVAVKLLFSLATPQDVPYLRHAKTWDIHDGSSIVKARLMQMDILVKDKRVKDGANPAPNDDLTGWVMGTFFYNGSIETTPRCDKIRGDEQACEQSRWQQRMVPVGLQWGNDPQIYDGAEIGKPVQHWLNDDVTQMFKTIRTVSGHPPSLGRDGRMNGPVDNHRSTCLACHGRAVDYGQNEPRAAKLIPFVPPLNARIEDVRRYFRNLDSDDPANNPDDVDVPFLKGTQSLDYSLQAAVGMSYFRQWVATQILAPGLEARTSDFTPGYE